MSGKIGFIGLGIMGKPMARNLIKAGYSLVVYRKLDEAGAEQAASPRDVAERAEDVIITMLPDSSNVRDVVAGKNGIIEGCRRGQAVVDMSSIAPLASRELCALLAEKDVDMIDAPVSGGQEKAESGTLAIMAGGGEAAYERVKPILDVMGRSVRVGESGAGQIAKLVNQTIVAINIAAVAEGMSLAEKAGVDPRMVFEAIRKGLAGSQCLEDKAPRMFEGRYDPGARIKLHIKDLANVLETGRALHNSMPLSAILMEMFQSLAGDGGEALDHGALGLFYEKLNGISLKKS
ncbi:MAG: NAD-binding protein [Synergistaceae bacterium]|jgi:2-hydroxy-3-oxopropionate reductase|nr:NAD-binding protein [Synergistaceae bacterium]